MPEGDTIHKLANAMRPALEGCPVTTLQLGDRGDVALAAGTRVASVEALGKHLLIGLGDAWVLRTHLGMNGSWHRYRPGEPWRRSASSAGVVLGVSDAVFVCFGPRHAELFPRAALADHPLLTRLGPDLLGPHLDLDRVVARARAAASGSGAVGELLLDQSVACGLGNVYKSELLFIHSVHPWHPASVLSGDTLRGLYRDARALMRRNLGPGRRITTLLAPPGHRPRPKQSPTWVYRRARRPCLVCGAPVETGQLGEMARATYWCPRCQGDPRPRRA